MSLTDVVSHLDLAIWPKMAMVLFLAVFVAVMARVLRTGKGDMDRAAHMPIEEEGGHG
jgi:hypothetical protein